MRTHVSGGQAVLRDKHILIFGIQSAKQYDRQHERNQRLRLFADMLLQPKFKLISHCHAEQRKRNQQQIRPYRKRFVIIILPVCGEIYKQNRKQRREKTDEKIFIELPQLRLFLRLCRFLRFFRHRRPHFRIGQVS